MDAKLKKLYYDVNEPSSYYSLNKLYHALKSKSKNKSSIKKKNVLEWLESQDAFSLHKQRHLRYIRRNYQISGVDDCWESDLIDLKSISSYNDGFSYILVVIDCLSKYAWTAPLISKSCPNVSAGFAEILARSNDRKPIILQTDKGREYLGQHFQKLMQENGIHFRVARGDTKAAIAERFNRTLKTRLWRYFTSFNTKRYIDVLDGIVDSYNRSINSATKMAPADINLDNASLASKNLEQRYGTPFNKNKKPKYSVNDLVRVSTAKNVFQKTYEGTFTEEIFKISRISQSRAPYAYILQDLAGEEVDGIFYEEELSRVRKDLEKDTFIVKEILRTEGSGRNKRYFVSWVGYPEKFNSYIPASSLEILK